jgi:hypothetical protein
LDNSTLESSVGWGSRALQVFYFSFRAFAAEQRRDSNSMLNWTERINRTRKEVPDVGGDAVLGFQHDKNGFDR